MSETILIGQGREMTETSREEWEQGLSGIAPIVEPELEFMSEEHARASRVKTDQIDGNYFTLEQCACFDRIVQSAIFAFKS